MPYAPNISYDTSSFGRAIGSGLERLAMTVAENQQERQRKEEERKARQAVEAAGKELFGGGFDLKDAPRDSWGQIIQLSQAKKETPIRALEVAARGLAVENEKLRHRISARELEQLGANSEAMKAAAPLLVGESESDFRGRGGMLAPADSEHGKLRTADPAAALSTYMGRGGSDPRMIAELGGLAAAQARAAGKTGPQRVDLGGGVTGVWDGNNFSRDPQSKQLAPVAQTFEVGGRKLIKVGNSILDERGFPVKAPVEKPIEPIAMEMMYNVYNNALAAVKEAEKTEASAWFKGTKEKAGEQARRAKQKANLYAERLGYGLPFPEADQRSVETSVDPDTQRSILPYRSEDVQAEMKRRGLIE